MDNKSIFNATVCLIGVLILFIHIVNILLKKEKRKDEISLFIFFVFTMVHFATYFAFVLIKQSFTNDALIISFYTIFYIMNNVEVLLFFKYLTDYAHMAPRYHKIFNIVNLVLFGLICISDIVNIFTRMYFTSVDGVYTRGQLMIVSQAYQFIMLFASFVLVIVIKKLNIREKIAFSLYCFLPFIAIIVQNNMPGYAIAYLALFLAVEILFLFLNVEKNIKLKEEEDKLKEANIKIMVSQIQPHFVYNTLSSISTLIPIEPKKAQRALDEFSDYLRMNFSTLTGTTLVPFEDELKHIKTYVNLEKIRFGGRLKAIYDIGVTAFFVPPLSIQPLVENAIKHGVLKKIEGGTVTLRTYQTDLAYVVEIIDDGVGFDIDEIDFTSNKHIGLNNVKYRISSMKKGNITFESEKNRGTKVTVSFYK